MNIYMYIYIYIYMYIYTHIHIHIYIYVCVCVCMCVRSYLSFSSSHPRNGSRIQFQKSRFVSHLGRRHSISYDVEPCFKDHALARTSIVFCDVSVQTCMCAVVLGANMLHCSFSPPRIIDSSTVAQYLSPYCKTF